MADAMKSAVLRAPVEQTANLMYQGPEQFDAAIRQQTTQFRDDFKKFGIRPE